MTTATTTKKLSPDELLAQFNIDVNRRGYEMQKMRSGLLSTSTAVRTAREERSRVLTRGFFLQAFFYCMPTGLAPALLLPYHSRFPSLEFLLLVFRYNYNYYLFIVSDYIITSRRKKRERESFSG